MNDASSENQRRKLKAKRKLEKVIFENSSTNLVSNHTESLNSKKDSNCNKSDDATLKSQEKEDANINMNSLSIVDEAKDESKSEVLLLQLSGLRNLPDIENEKDFSFKEFYQLYKDALQQLARITQEQYKSSIKKDHEIKVLKQEVVFLHSEIESLKQWQSIAYSEIQKANTNLQNFSNYINVFQTADSKLATKVETTSKKKQTKSSEPVFYGDSSYSKKLSDRKKVKKNKNSKDVKNIDTENEKNVIKSNEIVITDIVNNSSIVYAEQNSAIETNVSNTTTSNQITKEVPKKSIEELLRETAESTVSSSGLAYDEASGLYYDWNLKMYYDPSTKLYYDHENGVYYYYDSAKNSYIFHSQINLPEHEKMEGAKNIKEELSDGEIESDEGENESKIDPCIRIIVVQSDTLDVGNLFIVTVKGTTIGCNSDNSICIPDKEVSDFHATVIFDKSERSFFLENKSSTGLYINNEKFCCTANENEPIEVSHRDYIKIGNTTFSFHIHLGHGTCNDCEPGNIKAIVAQNEKEADPVTLDLNTQRKKELKSIRKKYNINPGYVPEKLISSIPDRAGQRRMKVGSDPYESNDKPIEKASVHHEIPESNLGHKMLAKMGWKSGKGLGKTGDGIVNPITVDVLQKNKGLGSGNKQSIADNTNRKSQDKWDKARERFDKL